MPPMPRQTRSQVAKGEESEHQQDKDEQQMGSPESRTQQSISISTAAEQAQAQAANTRDDPNVRNYESPETAASRRSRVPLSSSSSRPRPPPFDNRGPASRAMRLPLGPTGDMGFSPPGHYKSDRSHHAQHSAQMDYDRDAPRRDYDDLDLHQEMNMAPEMEDPLFLGSFAEEESPTKHSEHEQHEPHDMDPQPPPPHGSDRKRPAMRRSPPQPPYYHPSQYSNGNSTSYRRSPPSAHAQSYHPQQPPPPGHGASRGPPPPYHYGSYPPPPPHESYAPRSTPPGGGSAMRHQQQHDPQQQQGGYYQGGYPPSYYHYHPESQGHWDHHYHPPYELEEDEIPAPPPMSSTKKREPPRSPQRETPPKDKRSPFRTPNLSASKKYRRSPNGLGPSPYIGGYGSFGMMDTPSGAVLGASDFSPMGPAFQFAEDPLRMEDMPCGVKLNIGRSESDESDPPMGLRRKDDHAPSALDGFMRELAPMDSGLQGVPRSPIRHTGYPESRPPSSRERSAPPKGAVTMSERREAPTSRIMGSPMESSSTKPRKLWPTGAPPTGASPAVRVQLGATGSLSNRQKSLEGINSMMQPTSERPRETTPSSHGSRPPPPHHPYGPPPHHMNMYHHRQQEMATPLKSHQHAMPTPGSARGLYQHPGSAHKPGYSPSPMKSSAYPGSGQKPTSAQKITPMSGKENKSKKASTPKASPCNCKKSKCLKLYCECFAAERFCSGCNCSDCGNTPHAGMIRDKAIKETRAKNPNAFKARIGLKQGVQLSPSGTGHNMGCRCKRSECLKKYCECFQAGVICGGKCKCVDCLNYAGSQALIDKRRKIKDQRGADFAMRVADEAWKGQPGGPRKPAPSAPRPLLQQPQQSPATARFSSHSMHPGHPSPRGPPPGYPPHYMHQGLMMGPPMGGPMTGLGYSPMGGPMTPAGYYPPMSHGEMHGMYPPPPQQRLVEQSAPPKRSSTPRTPAVRVEFDPASSRKKRKLSPGAAEPTLAYFGNKLPEQPKTTALAIFSFLSNDDLYNAGLVCKSWTKLAMDEELWKFQS